MDIVKDDINRGKITNKDNYDGGLDDDEFEKYIKEKKIIFLPAQILKYYREN